MAKAFDSTADVQAGKWVEGQVAVVSINTFLRMLISDTGTPIPSAPEIEKIGSICWPVNLISEW